MGSAADDKNAYDNEKPAHKLTLLAFRISRYLITNAQYRPFVEADGYDGCSRWEIDKTTIELSGYPHFWLKVWSLIY